MGTRSRLGQAALALVAFEGLIFPLCHDPLSILHGSPPGPWLQCLREPGLQGLCWYGWERSPPSSSSSPGSAASAACRVLPSSLSRAIGVEQPRGAAKGTGSSGAHRA